MNKTILTAGPSITKQEIDSVLEAIKHSWGKNAYSRIQRFEEEFSNYTKFKYSMSTSSGTTALALAFSAIGLQENDEVIIPDLCYFSPLDEIIYRGAKPIFVDILEDTWCIDPEKIKKAITNKTKAIMPVYLYGNLTEGQEIRQIADKYGLYVIDDSCPAVGSFYKGKHAGAFSDIACFSFQGAKIMTTGLGGMICTNSNQLFKKIQKLNRQGESYERKFFQEEHGYSYDMSDLTASLGIAQLSRINKLINKKHQIFSWYAKKLNYPLNVDRKYSLGNKWMTSILVEKRDYLRKYLKENGIDTRPFFRPASSFPMYDRVDNKVSYYISERGINLPSGHNLTKSQVSYICDVIFN